MPTGTVESDGTLEWASTTVVVVRATADGRAGIGWSYTSAGASSVVHELLAPSITGRDVDDVGALWQRMIASVRNVGRSGIAGAAIAAADIALWDLKARLLGASVVDVLGRCRDAVPAYGSGGFCSYSDAELSAQLAGWAAAGLSMVKMKVGRDPDADPHRVAVARHAIGPDVQLFVHANGAYSRAQALEWAARFGNAGVTWFEEPVSSDDVDGLRLVREHAPAAMDVAAGEYSWTLDDVGRLLRGDAVDVVQIDATRCTGFSGFVRAAARSREASIPVSAHTAPTLHAHVACCTPGVRHIEYFHDHVRVEHLLFDGALDPARGELRPDPAAHGLGIELKERDADRYTVRRAA